MKYQNNQSENFFEILNNNINSIKVAFKTNNNLIKHINNRVKHFFYTVKKKLLLLKCWYK